LWKDDISTVPLLVEQTEADEKENENKQKNNHDHPQLAERLQSPRARHAQIIIERRSLAKRRLFAKLGLFLRWVATFSH
jgi:hypothetical protein